MAASEGKRVGETCPCGTGKSYAACCGMLHAGLPAPTAEALMRSRYAAFALQLDPYLFETWHPSTRPLDIRLTRSDPPAKYMRLEVKRAVENGDKAEVEFVARYKRGGGSVIRMHETSRFVREGGRWYYVDGDQNER